MKELIEELLKRHEWCALNVIANGCSSDSEREYLYEINNIIEKMKGKKLKGE